MKLFKCIFIGLVCLMSQLHAEDTSQLVVTGKGTVSRPADQFNLTLGVITQDQNLKKAMSLNAEKMNNVLISLRKLGLSDHEVHTGGYSIIPQYSPTPKNPPPDWQPSIVGYQVQNTLDVKTMKLYLVQDIIDISGSQGVNQIQNLNFSLHDEQSAMAEAIRVATQQARFYAEAAASAAKITLGPAIEISINPTPSNGPIYGARTYAFAKEVSTPIVTGDLDVTASVSITYSIF